MTFTKILKTKNFDKIKMYLMGGKPNFESLYDRPSYRKIKINENIEKTMEKYIKENNLELVNKRYFGCSCQFSVYYNFGDSIVCFTKDNTKLILPR